MKIDVKRFEYGTNYTISKLYIDGDYFCFVLEDKVRELDGTPVYAWKVPGETAIPKGTYKVVYNFSNHFQKVMPQILDVPGFEGIRIHGGNTDKNTEGCLLLGASWAGGDLITGSQLEVVAFERKVHPVFDSGEEILLQIGDSVKDFS